MDNDPSWYHWRRNSPQLIRVLPYLRTRPRAPPNLSSTCKRSTPCHDPMVKSHRATSMRAQRHKTRHVDVDSKKIRQSRHTDHHHWFWGREEDPQILPASRDYLLNGVHANAHDLRVVIAVFSEILLEPLSFYRAPRGEITCEISNSYIGSKERRQYRTESNSTSRVSNVWATRSLHIIRPRRHMNMNMWTLACGDQVMTSLLHR